MSQLAEPEEVFDLDPFQVQVERDEGFVAATSFAGGRMSTELSETAAAYSVQTREFLEALNIEDVNEALDWTVNATTIPDAGEGQLFGGTGSSTIRGVTTNTQNRNFFAGGSNAASYNVERLDYARGPNSSLFGTGSISGTSNVVVKRAQMQTNQGHVRYQIGSWNSHRWNFDVNRSVTRNLAFRVTGEWSDSNSWRKFQRNQRRGIAPGFSWRLTNKTRLTVMTDFYQQDVTQGMTMLTNRFSGWDGVTTYSGWQPNTNQSAFGAGRYGSSAYIWSPASGAGDNVIVNYEGMMRTQGYLGQRPLNGVFPLSNSQLGLNGAPILNLPFEPEGFLDAALEGSEFVVPPRSFNAIGPNRTSYNKFGTGTFYLDHRVNQNLTLQLSGNRNLDRTYGLISYFINNGFPHVYIDINEQLPDGRENPNFLKPYNEFFRPERQFVDSVNEAVRFALAHEDEFGWVDVRSNLIISWENVNQLRKREYYMLPIDPDSRQWGYISGTRAQTIVFRYYWDQEQRQIPDFNEVTLLDPLTGETAQYSPLWTLAADRTDATLEATSETKYIQGSTSLGFFDRKLLLFGAYRFDDVDRSRRQFAAAMDHPEGSVITGDSFIFRPDAPQDYWSLSYVPKDSMGNPADVEQPAVSRPRDGDGVALPVYANDRFQDDFNPPSLRTRVSTGALGAIYNIGWGVSIWANYAQTFNPSELGRTTIDFGTPQHSISRGTDVGLRYSIGPRLNVSLSRYDSREKNAEVSQPSGYSNINLILQANPVGDFRFDGRNQRNIADRPPFWSDEIDRETRGWEFELTANPISGLRVTANFGTADAAQVNAYRQTRAWVDENDAVMRLILEDAGVSIDQQGVATVRTDLPDRSPDAPSAANAWNNLQAARANWVTGRQPLFRNTRYTANFFADYTLQETVLEGLRIGYGMRVRGRQVIGWRGADTIVDPENPNAAINDPSVDALTPVYRGSFYTSTLTMSYPFTLQNGNRVRLNLSVDNLFNFKDPLYYNTRMRPPEGDIRSPARVATKDGFYFQLPINYRLSVRYDF